MNSLPSTDERSELEQHARVALDWPELLAAIAEQAHGERAREALMTLRPAATRAEALLRTARLRSLLELQRAGVDLPVAAVPELTEALARIRLGASAAGAELVGVLRVLRLARELRERLVEHADRAPLLSEWLSTDPKLDRTMARLELCLEPSGNVADAASEALVEARARTRAAREELKRRSSDLVQRYADVLSGSYSTERDGRHVLPVRADAHYRVEGIVLGVSASGGTLFVEPRELTELGNRLRVCEAGVAREEARVLAQLSDLVREQQPEIECAIEACVNADILSAIARFAHQTQALPLDVAERPVIDLRAARHPLLSLSKRPVVANDVRLEAGQGLVISGPNAGGKTVTLKLLGLFAWMIRAGLPLPTGEHSEFGWFDCVLSEIGDEQSLLHSLSTFSAHVQHLSQILQHTGPGTLVLLDEVAAGTDPEEGAVLACAVLEALAERGGAVVTTTHYERLKELAAKPGRLRNACVGFDFAQMSPTFRLTLGMPGPSSALLVAARYGIPAELLQRARALLPEAAIDREATLQELAKQRERVDQDRTRLESDRREHEALARELDQERREQRAAAERSIEAEARKLLRDVQTARSELYQAREKLKQERLDAAQLKALENSVNRVASQVAIGGPFAVPSRAASSQSASGQSAGGQAATLALVTPERLRPGTQVRLRENGALATVLEAPQAGEVRLRVGALRMTRPLGALSPVAHHGVQANSAPKRVRRAELPKAQIAPQRTRENTLDLRGIRVDDVASQIDAFLDRMLGEGEPVGFVLHGHGTGAVRQATREHLASSSYVEHSRAAEPDEGGNAFTVFWVR
ncbi:MAG TPA: Smr/MutS family protein [Polyangiaceae bacterium]|nr:Smr/MutS family protein [Polyangiaceae bacterium]